MGRKCLEINPESGRRLKELIVKSGKTQKTIADILNCEPQHISNIVRGKRRLTPDMAQEIKTRIFPDVRIEWLLGTSNFKTDRDKEEHSAKVWEDNHKAQLFHDKVFQCFIDGIEDLCGWGLRSLGSDILIGDYISVSDESGEAVGVLPLDEFKTFQQEIEHYASYQLNLLIKTKLVHMPSSKMEVDANG